MRILHTSDWHLGCTLEGRSRLPEQEQFIDELVAVAGSEDVQLVLLAGDVFDTYNPSADAEKLFFDAMERLSAGGKRAIVVIAGNHDSPERLQAANPLAVKHGISILGYPGQQLTVHSAFGGDSGGVRRVATGAGWLELELPGCEEKAVIYALPYPSEARLNEVLVETLEEHSQQIAYSERISRLFREADPIFRPDTVNLTVAHLFAFGGVASDSERQLGGALAVSPQAMPKSAQYIALGHLHRPQQLHTASVVTRYSGSPLALSFSEADQQKEVVLVDVVPGGMAQVQPVNLNCGKVLKRWRAGSFEEALSWCREPKNQLCWVDLEIMVDKPLEMGQLAELRKAHSGLIFIQPVFPEMNGETAEALKKHKLAEMPLADRFKLFYERENGIAPAEDLVGFFLEMVNQSELDNGKDADSGKSSKRSGGEVA